MKTPIVVYLGWPPTVNSYYHVVGHARGVRRISENGRKYRKDVAEDLAEQVPEILADPLGERLKVTVSLCPPDRRRRDVDNYAKSLLDACTHAGLWKDDEQVDQLQMRRGQVVSRGAVRLQIEDAEALDSF